MEIFSFLIIVGTFYGVLFFFDSFFRSCMHYPYYAFLNGTGLTIKFLRLQWYTTAFNRTIFKWSTSFKRVLSLSFNVGVYTALILLPIAVAIIIMSTFGNPDNSNTAETGLARVENIRIDLMLPGVNLPINEIVYYILALAISSIIHELGHAMAAVLEDVPLNGFGVTLFFMIPIAYTDLGVENLNSLKMWKKLKVLCAGIWHNMLLALVSYLLYCSIPMIGAPFYDIGSSVVITDVKANAPINGARGIQHGDIITEINNCQVSGMESWYTCLLETIQVPPAYCLTTDFVHQSDESIPLVHKADGSIECCDPKNTVSACFEYITDNGELEVPQFMCLNIRKTLEAAHSYCNKEKCGESEFCIKPLMNNSTTILQVKRNYNTGNDMIYMGHPADFVRNVRVSEFVPKTRIFSSELGDSMRLLLKYVVVFSLGLAVINVIPCFGFDGQHIMNTLLNQALMKRVPKKSSRELITLFITVLGTLLLFINLIKTIWLSLYKYIK